MSDFYEGVRPGGLTTSTEVRILLCYLLDSIPAPTSRAQIDEVLLGEELVNYFVLAQSMIQLKEQGLVEGDDEGYTLTEAGRTVGRSLARSVPLSVREAALRAGIRAQQYAAKAAAHHSEILTDPATGRRSVHCAIGDEAGPLFRLELYMPDALSAEAARERFIECGDEAYKLLLAALTQNRELAQSALDAMTAKPGEE